MLKNEKIKYLLNKFLHSERFLILKFKFQIFKNED